MYQSEVRYALVLESLYNFIQNMYYRLLGKSSSWLGKYQIKEDVTTHWTGLLDWNTGLDYWTDIFLVFTHLVL